MPSPAVARKVAAWCARSDDPDVRGYVDELASSDLSDLRQAREDRDELIQEMARTMFGDMGMRPAAEAIETALNRFRETAWRRTRTAAACPFTDPLQAHCWHILATFDRPLSAERIRKIVVGHLGVEITHAIGESLREER